MVNRTVSYIIWYNSMRMNRWIPVRKLDTYAVRFVTVNIWMQRIESIAEHESLWHLRGSHQRHLDDFRSGQTKRFQFLLRRDIVQKPKTWCFCECKCKWLVEHFKIHRFSLSYLATKNLNFGAGFYRFMSWRIFNWKSIDPCFLLNALMPWTPSLPKEIAKNIWALEELNKHHWHCAFHSVDSHPWFIPTSSIPSSDLISSNVTFVRSFFGKRSIFILQIVTEAGFSASSGTSVVVELRGSWSYFSHDSAAPYMKPIAQSAVVKNWKLFSIGGGLSNSDFAMSRFVQGLFSDQCSLSHLHYTTFYLLRAALT